MDTVVKPRYDNDMTKQELRLYFKEFLIKNQDKINSDLFKNSLINKISRLLKELKVKTVGLYYPLKYEINLLEITNLHPEIKFFLPKIIADEIKYCSYKSNDELVLGEFKTYEPINNDFFIPELVIIPGLAFSNDGYRLGYGKGHFDRYLNNTASFRKLDTGEFFELSLCSRTIVRCVDLLLNSSCLKLSEFICNRNILAVGVCLKEQLIHNFPVEPHDRKLDFVISV